MLLDNGRTRVLRDEVGRAGAALHPLQRVPQRLPGLLAHRRARLRLGLPRPDRRDPHAAAHRDRERRVAAVRVEPLRRLLRGLPGQDRHPDGAAAPARPGGRGDGAAAERAAMRAVAWVFARPAAVRARDSGSAGSRSGRSCAAAGSAALPGAARRLDAEPRPEAGRARSSFREWWRSAVSAREEILGRVSAAIGGAAPPAPVARDYRRAGERDREARVALFCERVGEYRAEVRRVADRRDRGRDRRASAPAARHRRPGRPPGRVAARRRRARRRRRPRPARARRARRRRHRLHGRDRRDRHDRPHRGAARGPPRAHARPRPARLRRRGAPDRRARARGDRALATPTAAPDDVHLGPVGHLGHRAQPRRGRPRPAHARRAGGRMSATAEAIDVVVIGGGQAGLATSHELTRAGVEHVVLERGRVGADLARPLGQLLPGHPELDGAAPRRPLRRRRPRRLHAARRDRRRTSSATPPRSPRPCARASRSPSLAPAGAAASCSRRATARSARARSSSRPARTSGRTARGAPRRSRPTCSRSTSRATATRPRSRPGGCSSSAAASRGCQIAEELAEAGREVVPRLRPRAVGAAPDRRPRR